jgi:beta-lactamase superfamily II metal-dependent hydrolase
MNIHADFVFDRAGQGMFYHGNIQFGEKAFTLVYDCGTIGNKTGLSEVVGDAVSHFPKILGSEKHKIGLLAISHFDFDHVSHIPALFKKCSCDTVMMPYIAKELRIVYFAKSVAPMKSSYDKAHFEELKSLFLNPFNYMREKGQAKKIIIILSDDDDSESINGDISPIDMPDESNGNTESEFDGTPLFSHIPGYEPLWTERVGSVEYSAYRGSPIFAVTEDNLLWRFKPLSIYDRLPKSLYCDVRCYLRQYNNDWNQILSDIRSIRRLRDIYDNHIKHTEDRRRNAHSLLLRHEPGHEPMQGCELFPDKATYLGYRGALCETCSDYCPRCTGCDEVATVLLGDLELTEEAQEILIKHDFIDSKTGIIHIPHHGADSDDVLWLDKMVGDHSCGTTLVASYGTKNRYGHPRFIHDGTMAKIRNPVHLVNEHINFQYCITS